MSSPTVCCTASCPGRPHPQQPVACRLLLEPVCSSQVTIIPPFYLLSVFRKLRPFSVLVDPYNWKRSWVWGGEKRTEVQGLALSTIGVIIVIVLPATAACDSWRKQRPLWTLEECAGADIFLSCLLPLKCPFCVSYWENGVLCSGLVLPLCRGVNRCNHNLHI